MRLNRPQVTLNLRVERFSDVEAALWRFTGDHRLFRAAFHPHRDGGFTGTATAIAVGLEPPEGAAWVESELWHPQSTLTLHTVETLTIGFERTVAEFVDSRMYRIAGAEVVQFNSQPPEYHCEVDIYLGAPREEVTICAVPVAASASDAN